jgi:nicotinamide-nucleotide amidase
MSYKLSREEAQRVIGQIRKAIQQYFRENGLTYAVFGKSEGLDSSVIAGLLSDIDGVKPISVIMPCESDPEAERIARIVLDHFNVPYLRVDLTREYHGLMGNFYSSDSIQGQLSHILGSDEEVKKTLPHRKLQASGNVKARLRMITLYHIAQLTGGIVISTDNLSELWMGFWTLNGDVGDLSPIQYLWKGLEEYAIAEELGVPKESLDAVPTDGLEVIPGGTDEDQLGLPYKELDRVIIALLQNRLGNGRRPMDDEINNISNELSGYLGHSPEKINHIARQIMRTNYKRNWPKAMTREEIGLPDIQDIKI